MITAADKALYLAKTSGRDRIVVADAVTDVVSDVEPAQAIG
jgi:hypothetical protein